MHAEGVARVVVELAPSRLAKSEGVHFCVTDWGLSNQLSTHYTTVHA